ncbi:hypothetical protein SOM61_13125 [Massilia sp. CFBP9012]|nr:hypothetical protein [Massilia sp. CFBP9012]MDY0975911.1 hypothetical protein [Massilia sp. CFBP9012]
MKALKFAKLFGQLPLLNQPQRQQVLAALHPAAGLDRVVQNVNAYLCYGKLRDNECPSSDSAITVRCHRRIPDWDLPPM